jgi:hypothetical protein
MFVEFLTWMVTRDEEFLDLYANDIQPGSFRTSEVAYLVDHAVSFYKEHGGAMTVEALIIMLEAEPEDRNLDKGVVVQLYEDAPEPSAVMKDFVSGHAKKWFQRLALVAAVNQAGTLLEDNQIEEARDVLAAASIETRSIGFDQRNPGGGIEPAHLATYDIDEIQPFVNRYADPHVELGLQRFEHGGAAYLAIGAEEFREIPVICQRDSPDNVLKKGAMYVRGFRLVETTMVQTADDMCELLELATNKGVERFVRTARQSGVGLESGGERRAAEAFAAQAKRAFE